MPTPTANAVFADLDLNAAAAKREVRYPDGIPVPFKDVVFTLPSELPGDILDPFLDLDLDLASVMADAARLIKNAPDDKSAAAAGIDIIAQVLAANPTLPFDLIKAVRGALANIFNAGEDGSWDTFVNLRPTLNDYFALVRGLTRAYGVGLGEALPSRGPSGTGGGTSSGTSRRSVSTRGGSGTARARKATSGSAA